MSALLFFYNFIEIWGSYGIYNLQDKNMKHALILGATSDIGIHIASELAKRGYSLCLTGRNAELLKKLKENLSEYKVDITTYTLDISDFASHHSFYHSLPVKPDTVFCCIGYYEDQTEAIRDYKETVTTINANLTGIMTMLNVISNDFATRKSGSITVLSSVAGERGRQLNYIYGAAKAGLSVYLSGLRNRIHKSGVSVTTVQLGPVYTKMSAGHNLMPVITLQPEVAAKKIVNAGLSRKDIVYIYWAWRYIMLIIRWIPEWIFKRLPPF